MGVNGLRLRWRSPTTVKTLFATCSPFLPLAPASTDDDDTRVVKTVGFAKWKASLRGGQPAVHITTAWGQTVAAILSTESDFQGPYAVILACGRREVEDACTRLTWFSCQRNSG